LVTLPTGVNQLLNLEFQALNMLILRFENLSNEETAKTLSNGSDSKEAYSKSDCEAIKASILRVLELWIERHPEDWQQPPKYILVQRTLQFCSKYKVSGFE
jgi:lauroyl/myristoyl acyltransferase